MRGLIPLLRLFAIVLCSFIGFAGFPGPITRTGLTNVGVKQVDSCLLVYAISAPTNSLVIEMYDPQLRLIHQLNEKIVGCKASYVDLSYSSGSRFEFSVGEMGKLNERFFFLDKELKPFYKSQSTPPVVLMSEKTKILNTYRIDDFAWEIRTETEQIGWSGSTTFTRLYQYGIKLNPAFPVKEMNRAIVLDSSAVEYAKVFLVRDNKVYVYVNQSTERGQQFIYCFSIPDGTMIYKTQIVASFSDLLLEDANWDIVKFPKSDAAIFSNYFWDDKSQRLIVGGTWILNSEGRTGTFLLQLDDSGQIAASCVDYDYWYETLKPANNPVDFHSFARNKNTWYRFKNMGYQGDGTFSVLVEAYAEVNLFRTGGIYEQDEFHHYFSVEAYYYHVKAGSIKRKCDGYPVRVTPWANSHRLDSISGYIQGKTRMGDKQFNNDVNVLCDGSLDGYFRSVIRGPGKNATKVLTREPVMNDGINPTTAYFAKQAFSLNNSNRIAFVEPTPVRQQKFGERNDYYPIDGSRIYRVTTNVDGFTLKVIGW
jgi:hypothetical protein